MNLVQQTKVKIGEKMSQTGEKSDKLEKETCRNVRKTYKKKS